MGPDWQAWLFIILVTLWGLGCFLCAEAYRSSRRRDDA